MTAAPIEFESAAPSPAAASLNGLDGINLFVAGMQAGFGPYVAVYLADQKWPQQEIGLALTVGGLAGLLSQVPGGELVDLVRSKRTLIALGALIVAVSAIIIDFGPTLPFVLIGLILQGITGGVLGPAIAAVSLGLVGLSDLSERVGRNQRFASIGSLAGTGLMGVIAYFLSYQAIFAMVAVLLLPMLVALVQIRSADIHFGRGCGAPDHHTIDQPARIRRASLWTSPALLTFATSLFLFQLANASILPVVGEALVYRKESYPSLVISALIILPEIIVALVAPKIGRQAQSWGRRPLFLVGLSALAIRAMLFAWITNPLFLVAVQLLDGLSGAVVGVLTAVVIADITNGTGRFNLAQGIVGMASGIGASLSTALSGLVIANFGRTAVFLSLASVAMLAVLIFLSLMPETKPSAAK
jgi:MFS family permease